MPNEKPQKQQKHPPNYAEDLNPDYMAGQNIGSGGPDSVDRAEYASQRKDLVDSLVEFNKNELAQIPLVRAGARLKRNATYLDIRMRGSRPFTATGDEFAPEGRCIVAKAETPNTLWNRLVARE
jgi:hypothetical protein